MKYKRKKYGNGGSLTEKPKETKPADTKKIKVIKQPKPLLGPGNVPLLDHNGNPIYKKQHAGGGFFKDAGDFFANYGKGVADTALSTLGASNVIKDSDYSGTGANFMKGAANVVGGVGKAILPMAANVVAPGSGVAVTALQGMGSSMNPEDPSQTKASRNFQTGAQVAGMGLNHMQAAGAFDKLLQQPQVYAMGGELTHFNGPTHEEGGIALGQDAEVEGGETRHEDYIFSDRIKVPGKKITFAEQSKLIEKRYAKRPDDKLSVQAKQLELQRLTAAQESIRAKMMDNNTKMFWDGGYNTPGFTSELGGVPQGYQNGRIATAPLHNMQMLDETDNTRLKWLPGGDRKDPLNPGKPQLMDDTDNTKLVDPYFYDKTKFVEDAGDDISGFVPPESQMSEDAKLRAVNGLVGGNQSRTADPAAPTTSTNPYKPNPYNHKLNPYFMGAQTLGSLHQIYMGAKGPDAVNYDRVQANLVDYTDTKNQATRGIKSGFNGTKQAIKAGTNGNAGSYLANVVNAAGARDRGIGETITRMDEAQKNTNAQILNQTSAQNAQIQMAELEARQREKDAASTHVTSGLNNLGNVAGGIGKDVRSNEVQNMIVNLMNTGNYSYDEALRIIYNGSDGYVDPNAPVKKKWGGFLKTKKKKK